MKKSGIKKNKSSKTLKKLKEELRLYLAEKEFDKALLIAEKIKELYPKNSYGYSWYIKIKTNDYTCFLDEEELKEVKKVFEELYEVSSKKEKPKLRIVFDEYIADCKEMYNLEKIKKEKNGKLFLKKVYEEGIILANKNIKQLKSYYSVGPIIKDLYDLIKGLLFICCLIFNLYNRNYLLVFTIPFGIYGVIAVYDFIDSNIFKKNDLKSKTNEINVVLDEFNLKIEEYKKEIAKLDDTVLFLEEQKRNSILKIPNSFSNELNIIIEEDEEDVAKELASKLKSKNVDEFNLLLEQKTNFDTELFWKNINKNLTIIDEKLNIFLDEEQIKKKNNKQKALKMKKITNFNIAILIVVCIISFCFLLIIINNFYELNFLSFIVSFIVGIISMLIYNIEKGRHSCISDTFNDSLCICVFRTTLVYNLIYSWITNGLDFTYNFLEIPLIFLFIFIGPVMFVSVLKYNHLYKKLLY